MSLVSPALAPGSDNLVVRTTDICRIYGTEPSTVHALRGVSVEIRRAERVALLGKSGSGKSTLLNVLAGLDRPTSGNVVVGGRDLATLSSNDLAQHRLSTVGMIFQSFNLILSRTALENVELPMVFAGIPPTERRDAARRSLEAVGLSARVGHRPAELSGGEHQRVAIARALVNNPQILLADEPTGNLDSATSAEILELITAHVLQHGTTLVLVTHDEELARRNADRVLHMKDGQLLKE